MENFAKQPILQFALRELTAIATSPRLWMAFGLVVALFALAGPFGTYDVLEFPARLGYWFITQSVTWSIALCTIALCGAVLRTPSFTNVWTVVTGAAIASLPIAVAVELIGLAVFSRELSLSSVGWQLILTLPLAIVLGLFAYLAARPAEKVQPGTPVADNRLIKRLSAENRGKVLYLSMQDHYVQVVTSRGSELVLLRFGEALEELKGVDGLQIHRSHWVASDAVVGWRRDGGKLVLEMSDGADLPVSRTYTKSVRVAGLLGEDETREI